MDIQLEINVIKKFVIKEKQSRYIQFISSNRTRKKFLNVLPHFRDFKWDLFEEIGSEFELSRRLEALRSRVSNCYVISEDSNIDQKTLPVDEALNMLGGYRDHATILVFGNVEMIYFEGEPPKNQYISKIK